MKRDDENEGFIPSHVSGSNLDRGLSYGFPSDDQLEATIVDALTWAEGVDATSIQVTARSGVVVLVGDVGSPQERQRAEEVVCGVPWVTDVVNDLEVRERGSASAA